MRRWMISSLPPSSTRSDPPGESSAIRALVAVDPLVGGRVAGRKVGTCGPPSACSVLKKVTSPFGSQFARGMASTAKASASISASRPNC